MLELALATALWLNVFCLSQGKFHDSLYDSQQADDIEDDGDDAGGPLDAEMYPNLPSDARDSKPQEEAKKKTEEDTHQHAHAHNPTK